MARIKYYYDTETCRYERAKVTKSDILINFLGFLSVGLVMAMVMVLVYNSYFESPTEKALKKENSELIEHYDVLQSELSEVKEVIGTLEERDNHIYRKIYEAEPLPVDVKTAGGGAEVYKAIMEKGLHDKKLVASTSQRIDQLKQKASVKNRSFVKLMNLAFDKSAMLTSLPAIQPIDNPELTNLVSGFGMRINPFHKARVMHDGIDFAALRNTPVYATGDGRVMTAKENKVLEAGYGSFIEIDHGYGYVSKYAHLGELNVKQGATVKRGDVIGYVGSTGGSIAPHVHYEVIKDNKKIDPINFLLHGLNETQFKELLKLASRENQSFD